MKRLKPCILLLLGLLSLPLQAEEKGRISRLGDRLKNVEIRNAKNEPMMLPGFGKQRAASAQRTEAKPFRP